MNRFALLALVAVLPVGCSKRSEAPSPPINGVSETKPEASVPQAEAPKESPKISPERKGTFITRKAPSAMQAAWLAQKHAENKGKAVRVWGFAQEVRTEGEVAYLLLKGMENQTSKGAFRLVACAFPADQLEALKAAKESAPWVVIDGTVEGLWIGGKPEQEVDFPGGKLQEVRLSGCQLVKSFKKIGEVQEAIK